MKTNKYLLPLIFLLNFLTFSAFAQVGIGGGIYGPPTNYTGGTITATTGFISTGSGGIQLQNGDIGIVTDTGILYFGTSADVRLVKDASSVLAQRNGTNAQTFRIYNTYTDASNYERLGFSFNSGNIVIQPEAAGTGSTGRNLSLYTSSGGVLNFGIGGVAYWGMASGSSSFLPATTNNSDLGSTNKTVRTGYFGASVITPQLTLSTGTEPTCNSTNRGAMIQVYGGAGVKDTVRVCAKDATDTYAYRTIY